MDVNDLLVFVRVVQAGSFTKAARLLGMPKSTVSRRVADLELQLGVPLLLRTTRSLRITDVGGGYYRHGLAIAGEIEKADALLDNLKSVPQGTLKLTAPVDFGTHFLGPIVAAFLKANPRVGVDIVLTERVVDLVAEGFDLAIRIGDLEDSSLIARKIGNLEAQLWASPAYLKEHGEPRSCADLEKHPCVLFTSGDETPKWELAGPKGAVKTPAIHGRISANHFNLVREFCVRGDGVALMPYFFCAEDVRRGKLKPILKDWIVPSGPLHVVYPGQRFLQPKVRTFVEHLMLGFKDFPWRCFNR